MKARMQLAMAKMSDPRVVRVVLAALALAAATQVMPAGVEAVYASPSSGGGGCVGGPDQPGQHRCELYSFCSEAHLSSILVPQYLQ